MDLKGGLMSQQVAPSDGPLVQAQVVGVPQQQVGLGGSPLDAHRCAAGPLRS